MIIRCEELLQEVAELKRRNRDAAAENVALRNAQAVLTGKLKAHRAVAAITNNGGSSSPTVTRRGGACVRAV